MMILRPYSSTKITELITTSTSYVIATIVLLNNKSALLALTESQVVLKEFYFLVVALSRMYSHHAFQTVLDSANYTANRFLVCDNKSFAVFVRTKTFVLTVADFVVYENFIISLS